jgi:hypothetical protein
MTRQLKHRWSIGHNYLSGICFEDWWRLLRANRFAVDAVYWHRAAAVTVLSLVNSLFRRAEQRSYGRAVRTTPVAEPPLFVLGHWRSGTTHLHNLLALDTDRFAYPNTFQAVNPHSFLSTEAVCSRLFAFMVPPKRPMDNMALSFRTPQEDEFALLLGCLRSLYLGITFPRREDFYGRYLTFHGVPDAEVAEWKRTLYWFVQKLTYKYGRAVVLKSPPHTARIRLLLEVFPGARFVHIHRDPYVVFQSFRHYFDTAMWYTYLQRPDLEGIDHRILERYIVLYDAFFAQRGLIPAGQYHEMAFEALEADPIGQMRQLYERLALPGFDGLEPKLRRYLGTLAGYEKNCFGELPPELRDAVARQWRRSFDEWGYAV